MSNNAIDVIRRLFSEAWTHIKAFPKLVMMLYDLWQFKKKLSEKHKTSGHQQIIQPQLKHNLFSKDRAHRIYAPHSMNPDSPLVIYVNGIWTDIEQAKMELDLLADSNLGRHVDNNNYALMYNRSRGILVDLYDAIAARVWRRESNSVKGLKRYLEHLHLTGKNPKIVLVGYSQGGIIVSQALNGLSYKAKRGLSISCITIAGAQNNLDEFDGECHHIAHKSDYVAYTGVITHHKRGQIYGDLHAFDGQSHLLPKYIDQFNKVLDHRTSKALKNILK